MSDLISREEVQVEIDKLKEIHFDRKVVLNNVSDRVNAIPSADIMECARAIKDYCRDRDNLDEPCEGCPFHFYDGFAGFCVLNYGLYPNEWYKPDKRDLPEGEKEPPVFIDSAPLKDCKNTAESYGEICVKCNKCGRFGREKE